ncbi:hypothetical protein [Kitasatospora sp. NPDC015120]|uniref:hypothetical protein n=1 Tax=Kitasatospora sp. NPDC015120 TaxID=3364023 RepID=UPI0036F4861D
MQSARRGPLGARLAPGVAGRRAGGRAVLLGLATGAAGVLLLAATARTAGPGAAALAAAALLWTGRRTAPAPAGRQSVRASRGA